MGGVRRTNTKSRISEAGGDTNNMDGEGPRRSIEERGHRLLISHDRSEPYIEGTSEEEDMEENMATTGSIEDAGSSKCLIRRESDDGVSLMEPRFLPIRAEPCIEGISEMEGMEANLAATKTGDDAGSSKCLIRRESDDGVSLMEPRFLPIKAEPCIEGISEMEGMEANLAATKTGDDAGSSKCLIRRESDDGVSLMEPRFLPIKAEPCIEGISEMEGMEANLAATKTGDVSIHSASVLVKEEVNDIEIKEEPMSPLSSNISYEAPSQDGTVDGDNQVSTHTGSVDVKTEVNCIEIKEEPMSPLSSNIKNQAPFQDESVDGDNKVSINSASVVDMEEVNGIEINEEPMSPPSSKMSNEAPSEDETVDGDNQISIHSARVVVEEEVNGIEIKEEPMSPLSNIISYEAPSQDETVDGDNQVTIHSAGVVVKEEVNGIEIKKEPMSPPSSNMSNEAASQDETVDGNNQEFFKENKWPPDIKLSTENRSSQIATSPDMMEMDSQKYISKNSLSSEHETDLLPRLQSKDVLVVASCSTAERCLRMGHVEQQVAEERQCDLNEGSPGESHSQSAIQQSGSLICSTNERQFKCSVCGKVFPRKAVLERHKVVHSGEKPHKCNHCEKAFASKIYLSGHMKTHSVERPYKCSQCENAFKRRANLHRHMRTHTGEKPYKCQQCGYSFAQSNGLTAHMRFHSGDRPYKCPNCEESFSTSSNLTTHMQIHAGAKPHKCSQCGKSFASSAYLDLHMRIHIGVEPYRCSQCGISFVTSASLKSHKRSHTVDRPYKCRQCEKSYTNSRTLTVHMKTHTGEPYKCSQCGKILSTSNYLIRHQRSHTAD